MEEILKDWIRKRNYIILQDNCKERDALFISSKLNRISEKAVYNLVVKYTEQALGIKLSPHKLRAAFCTILYDQTKDAEFVKRAVGHKNISTTSRYIVSKRNPKQDAVEILNSLLK
jgi:site-specific recombinase XerD